MLDGSMYSNGIFTNKISQDLRVTEETIQGAASLEVVVSALMCFVASFITQKCGPKVVASWGALIAVLGWLGASYVPNLTLLIICQSLVVGSGFGCMYVAGVVAVGNSFKKNRSRALGLVTFSSALGQIGVSLAAGLLLDRWGWMRRQVFICKMFACVVCLVFSILLIPNNTSSSAPVAPTNTGANEANNASTSEEEATTLAQESREPSFLQHQNLGVFIV